MKKFPVTKIKHIIHKGEVYIHGDSIIEFFKDELLDFLTNPDEEVFASEYIKDRINLWRINIEEWEKKNEST